MGGAAGLGRAQALHQAGADPVDRFLALLVEVLSSGRAHVTDLQGRAPDHHTALGWQGRLGFDERALGPRIGVLAGNDLYLLPEATLSAVGALAREPIALGAATLGKRLNERGALRSVDTGRGTNTIRKMIDGTRQSVWHLSADALSPPEPSSDGEEQCNPVVVGLGGCLVR